MDLIKWWRIIRPVTYTSKHLTGMNSKYQHIAYEKKNTLPRYTSPSTISGVEAL